MAAFHRLADGSSIIKTTASISSEDGKSESSTKKIQH
jgi:hypothetical protein